MQRSFISFIEIYRFLKETSLGKTILQITIEHFHTILPQFFFVTLPTILPSIKCIKKYTSDKADFSLSVRSTFIYMKSYARIIDQWIFIHQTVHKKMAEYPLHIRYRIWSVHRFRTVSIITILPSMTNKIRIIFRFSLEYFPCQQNCLSFFQMLKSRHSWCQCQFTKITFRSLLIWKTKGECRYSFSILKSGKS